MWSLTMKVSYLLKVFYFYILILTSIKIKKTLKTTYLLPLVIVFLPTNMRCILFINMSLLIRQNDKKRWVRNEFSRFWLYTCGEPTTVSHCFASDKYVLHSFHHLVLFTHCATLWKLRYFLQCKTLINIGLLTPCLLQILITYIRSTANFVISEQSRHSKIFVRTHNRNTISDYGF